jgi:membrane complex biogenesis BtpA family protein
LTHYKLIGVIHLPMLPSTMHGINWNPDDLISRTLHEAKILEEAGFNGIIIENYGDSPFYNRVNDPLTLSSITVIVREVVKETRLEVGINLLRNSGREAYSIAVATGASFIRVNNLVETLLTDSGIIEPEAPHLKTVRSNYPGIRVYSDIICKHAISLPYLFRTTQVYNRSKIDILEEEAVREIVLDAVNRGKADALIVTGSRTGEPPDAKLLSMVKKYSNIPVLVGSGFNPENASILIRYSDGAIVGSYIKQNGKAGNPISRDRVNKLVTKLRDIMVR